jgi:hypothetical protein
MCASERCSNLYVGLFGHHKSHTFNVDTPILALSGQIDKQITQLSIEQLFSYPQPQCRLHPTYDSLDTSNYTSRGIVYKNFGALTIS